MTTLNKTMMSNMSYKTYSLQFCIFLILILLFVNVDSLDWP